MVTEKPEKPTPDWNAAKIKNWLQENLRESNGSMQLKYIYDYLTYLEVIYLLHSVCDQYDKKSEEYSDELKQLKNELEENKEQIQELSQTIYNKNQELANKYDDIINLKQDLKSRKQKIAELDDKLNEPISLLQWFVKKFPSYFRDGQATIQQLETEIKNTKQQVISEQNKYNNFVRNTYYPLIRKYDKLQQDEQNWSQEKQKLISEKKALKEENEKLKKTNDEQLRQIVSFKDKPSESIGDYEKCENYQIVTDYRTFCTGQALEITTEDIYNYLREQKTELQDDSKYAFFNAEIKATLSKTILVKPYEVQLRQLINKQPTVEFKDFFESYIKQLLSHLELSEELEEQLKKTAKKGFKLITELVTMKPLCQLLFAEEGDTFNTEEYEAATGCPKEGIIKFTVVPGVISANYQRLMKPIVFVEKSTKT